MKKEKKINLTIIEETIKISEMEIQIEKIEQIFQLIITIILIISI